jgi:hypothetical protein
LILPCLDCGTSHSQVFVVLGNVQNKALGFGVISQCCDG